jgi:putative tryptophan/tyrosine transport system substrate-binding protein
MRRREVIAGLGAAAGWPHISVAQQAAVPTIGYFGSLSPELFTTRLRAFHQGLRETGYVQARNVEIEYRWAEGHYDRIPALIADLVHHQVAVIATPGSTPAAIAAKAATTTIPIVFLTGTDPVEAGLVSSLNRPGGNLTGVTVFSLELGPKRVQLLHELIPTATSITLLVNPTSPHFAEAQQTGLRAVARHLGLVDHVLHASAPRDFEEVFATLSRLRASALVIGDDTLFTGHTEQLAALALRHGIPAIFQFREFAAAGGLMSYGPSLLDGHRLAGVYTGRILQGDKPLDLPVQQSTKVELVINLRTAKALGITIPLPLIGRADEVIE